MSLQAGVFRGSIKLAVPWKWPACSYGHHLLIRQELLQAQVEILFLSVSFFTHFSQPVQVNTKICSGVTQAALLTLVNEICSYSALIFNPNL